MQQTDAKYLLRPQDLPLLLSPEQIDEWIREIYHKHISENTKQNKWLNHSEGPIDNEKKIQRFSSHIKASLLLQRQAQLCKRIKEAINEQEIRIRRKQKFSDLPPKLKKNTLSLTISFFNYDRTYKYQQMRKILMCGPLSRYHKCTKTEMEEIIRKKRNDNGNPLSKTTTDTNTLDSQPDSQPKATSDSRSKASPDSKATSDTKKQRCPDSRPKASPDSKATSETKKQRSPDSRPKASPDSKATSETKKQRSPDSRPTPSSKKSNNSPPHTPPMQSQAASPKTPKPQTQNQQHSKRKTTDAHSPQKKSRKVPIDFDADSS